MNERKSDVAESSDDGRLPSELVGMLTELRKLHREIADRFYTCNESRKREDRRDQALLILMARVLKYFGAYILLAHEGYGEPAATLVRAIYEGCIWMRWCLVSPKNAEVYFEAGNADAERILGKLLGRGFLQAQFVGDDAASKISEVLRDRTRVNYPSFEKMAAECGMGDAHALFYPMLSTMAHGSPLHLAERLTTKKVDIGPDHLNVGPFVFVARFFITDCAGVYESWTLERSVHPPTDLRAFARVFIDRGDHGNPKESGTATISRAAEPESDPDP